MTTIDIPLQELLKHLFDSAHMPVAYMDTKFNFVKVNQAYASADEKSPEYFIGKNHFDLFPNTENKKIFQEVVKTSLPYHAQAKSFEYTNNPERGVTYWDWTLTPVSQDNETTGLLLQLVNVSNYIKAEKAIQKEYQFTKNIMNMSGDIIVVLDNQGKIVKFNKAAEHLTGYTFEEVEDEFVWDMLLMPEDIEPVKEVFNQVASSIPNQYENIWVTKNGEQHLIRWNNTFITGEKDELEYIIGYGQDLTESKETKLILERQSKIIDQLHDAVIATDLDGHILSWNKGAERIFGYAEDDVINKHVSIIYPKDKYGFFENEVIQPLKKNGSYEIETKMKRNSGEEFFSLLSLSLLYDDSGQAYGMIGYLIDISERKQIETELENHQNNLEKLVVIRIKELSRAKEAAERANHLKSSFISRMSHELRTPMNAIIGFSQLIKMENISDKERSFVDEVLLASEHLLTLINEVLDLSRIEADEVLLDMKPVSLYKICTESVTFVNFIADDFGIVMNNEISSDNDVLIYTDEIRFKEIIINFLTNAIKYNKKDGKVTLSMANLDNGFVRVTVTDTGEGISAENQADIFEPFNRLGAEFSDIEGTGIGLTIAKKLITLLGGKIGVESELNVGSSFWVECPISNKKLEEKSNIKKSQRIKSGKQNYRILYIEDNLANLRLIQHIIEMYKHIELMSATNAEDGIKRAKENDVDLILMDINLPGMDGYDALELLKADNKTKDTTVLAISASAGSTDIEKGLLAGFKHYLTKPLILDEFIEIIESELDS